MKTFLPLFALIGLVTSVLAADSPNTLTDAEKAEGWKLLFDGATPTGWVALGKAEFPSKGWSVTDGTLMLAAKAQGGDIVTTDAYENFELKWDWKIAPAGNSGLKYNLIDARKAVGFEYQLLDDAAHPDAKVRGRSRQTAGLYDLLEPAADKKSLPPGEWNTSRLLVRGQHVEHWLNGARTVEFEIGGEALKSAVAGSKYKAIAGFGEKKASPILLQDHGDAIAFRSLKLRVLDSK